VIDPCHHLYGHPGISVVDGAAVSANLGVNPSLTITAQAERAMAYWPNRGEGGRASGAERDSRAFEPRRVQVTGDPGGGLRYAAAAVK
jgi:cholesterol oxidase